MKTQSYKMEEALESIIDYRGKTPNKATVGIPTLSAKSVKKGFIDYSECYYISPEEYERFMVRGFPHKGDILLTTEAPMGMVAKLDRDDVAIAQRLLTLRGKKGVLDNDFLMYYLQSPIGQAKLAERETGSTVTGIKQAEFRKITIDIPDIDTQKKIAYVISGLDERISINKSINKNLEEQAQCIFKKMFLDKAKDRKHCRADELFDISIGKTPPRKEKEWFSENPDDVVWVSISDMGTSGAFISDSSEYITSSAVDRFNVRVVPDRTVILSFKLTVGRVAITDGRLTTNEAIAHFKTKDDLITEYLYCYLSRFDYSSLGSTSSIATAVNSKLIKGMEFIVPEKEEETEFHDMVSPMFMAIRDNLRENKRLLKIKDYIIPRVLMGKYDLEKLSL